MKEFKIYNENSTLSKDGFQVFTSPKVKDLINTFSTDLESISGSVSNSDVFRTKLGDIKQIQSLQNTPDFLKLNVLLADLIGAKKYKIFNNQYFCKPPNYKMTSAHQDNAYFNAPKERNIVTFWIPLQDVDLLNSCMFYVPESHKEGILPHDPIGTNVRVRTGAKGVSLYSSYYKNREFVKVPMTKGDILVHDKNCMHFSSPNLTDNYRMAVTCIMEILD